MTLQINVDPSGLTQSQREALAGFILAYPGKECAGTCGKDKVEIARSLAPEEIMELKEALKSHITPIVSAPEKAAALVKSIADDFAANVLGPAVAQLAADDAAFDAAQAFGSTPAPLPLGAVAPSTVVAAPSPTAPVDTPETTSITPPPAPPVPAPITSVAVPVPPAPAAPTNPVDLDKNGLPWDHRIHAESKAKIADGTWRKKRGADPAHVATVEAELRQLMGVPAAPVTVQQSESTPPIVDHVSQFAPPSPPAPVAAPAADPRQQFVALVGRTSAAINQGKVTKEEVTACCSVHGVAALPLLASRLDLVPAVAESIDALIGSK